MPITRFNHTPLTDLLDRHADFYQRVRAETFQMGHGGPPPDVHPDMGAVAREPYAMLAAASRWPGAHRPLRHRTSR
jgi:hypothetical protein